MTTFSPLKDQKPGAARREGHPGIALAVIAACQLMIVLDATIVNIALPHIQNALNFSTTDLTWVVSAYTLTFGGLLLLGGRAGDILGRRRVFMTGILLFTFASLLGGFAQEPWQLLAARVLQGMGGAIASPTSLALITTTFPEGPERNRAFGVFAAVAGGGAIGLLAGGMLTEWLDWRWVLFVNVPIGVLIAVLAPLYINESERHSGRFDIAGAVTSTAGMASLVYGFIRAADEGWRDSLTIGPSRPPRSCCWPSSSSSSVPREPITPLKMFADRNRSGTNEPPHAEQPHGEPVRHQQHVRRVVGVLEAAEQALQEAADPVVHVCAGLSLGEAVEEVPVGVAVGLLQAHVVAVLPVAPVLLAQPGLLAYPYEIRVEAEGAEGLVVAAVRGDDALIRSRPNTSRRRFPHSSACARPPVGEGERVVGFALVHGVIDVAGRLAVPDKNDAPWSCHARTLDRDRRNQALVRAPYGVRHTVSTPGRVGGVRVQTVQEGSSCTMSPVSAEMSASVWARRASRSTRSVRYLPCSAADSHMDSTRYSLYPLPGASPNRPRIMPGEPAIAGFQTFSCMRT
ncbi:Putative multidrug resistance protein MdtD [Streptomyces violaceorubidus]